MEGVDVSLRDQWVVQQKLYSVFHVDISLKHLLKKKNPDVDQEASRAAYADVSDKVFKSENTVVTDFMKAENMEEGEAKDILLKGHMTMDTEARTSSGFVVAQNGHTIRILTCAHSIGDVYSSGLHGLTVDTVNKMFRFDITCLHHEEKVISSRSKQNVCKRLRSVTPAEVVALDTEKDLIVLQCDTRDITLRSTKKGEIRCKSEHPVVDMAQEAPGYAGRLICIGWPDNLSKGIIPGSASCTQRLYETLTSVNTKGYNMTLMECPGARCPSGYSGCPVLNSKAQFVGLFHGVINKIGYAVSLGDIRDFLHSNYVLTEWTDTENEHSDEAISDTEE